MIFLANVDYTNFGRNVEERRKYALERDRLRRLIRKARQEPGELYVVQRLETLLAVLRRSGHSNGMAVLYLRAFAHFASGSEEIRCYFATSKYKGLKSTVNLKYLSKQIQSSGFQSVVLFLAVDDLHSASANIFDTLPPGILACAIEPKWSDLCSLLAVEVSNWSGTSSLNREVVTHSHVSAHVHTLIEAVCAALPDMRRGRDWMIAGKLDSSTAAWANQTSALELEPIRVKLEQGRGKRMWDTLNALAQVAADPRLSAQASLWYMSLPQEVRDLYPMFPRRMRLFVHTQGTRVAGLIHRPAINFRLDVDLENELIGELHQTFVAVPAGSFIMGRSNSGHLSDPSAFPEHELFLDTFWIMKYPLTRRQWDALTSGNVKEVTESAAHPAVDISFLEATEAAEYLTSLFRKYNYMEEGKEVILPSEAQWEKAARGNDGREYPWGMRVFDGCCNVAITGIGGTSAVGSFSAQSDSPYGCKDMSGNVREWTRSAAGDSIRSHVLYPYSGENEVFSSSMSAENQMIVRGGSYSYDIDCVKCWVRNKEVACQKRSDTGFRLVIQSRSSGKPLQRHDQEYPPAEDVPLP